MAHMLDRIGFPDETWLKTNMARTTGWAPRGQRLVVHVPFGHWRTQTFVAALRHNRLDAPWVIDGTMNRATFDTYVETQLAPTRSTINWNRDATEAFEEDFSKGHGRIERRRIQTMTPPRGTVNYPHIAQIFRIERDRETCKSGEKGTEITYGITSVPKYWGTQENLLVWNCGHWTVENRNHRARDVNFKEDACLSRTMHAPKNGAICNCIALAIIFRRSPKIAEMRRHFALNRHEAIEAVLSPG